eukprot:956067-Karenia_brevis.AAC.1
MRSTAMRTWTCLSAWKWQGDMDVCRRNVISFSAAMWTWTCLSAWTWTWQGGMDVISFDAAMQGHH